MRLTTRRENMKRKLQALSELREAGRGGWGEEEAKRPRRRRGAEEEASSHEEEEETTQVVPVPLHTARDVRILGEREKQQQELKDLVKYRNKQRVLVLSSRGTTVRFRHLMEDLCALLPHHVKEVKFDDKKNLGEINQLCEMKNCTGCVFFEVRKKKDLYMWLTRSPSGPSLKFLVTDIHTMDELKLTGNALHGSRPVLSFDESFSPDSAAVKAAPHLNLVREVLAVTFGTPRGHPKSKPFVDRVMHFAYLDGCVWVRNYQIVDETTDQRELKKAASLGQDTTTLVEIGPRFVLNLIKVLDGGFSGRTLFTNGQYVSPNELRAREKRALGGKYAARKVQESLSRSRQATVMGSIPENPLDDVF